MGGQALADGWAAALLRASAFRQLNRNSAPFQRVPVRRWRGRNNDATNAARPP